MVWLTEIETKVFTRYINFYDPHHPCVLGYVPLHPLSVGSPLCLGVCALASPLGGLTLVSWGMCTCFPSVHLSAGSLLCLGVLAVASPPSTSQRAHWCLGVCAVATPPFTSQRAHSGVLGYLQLLPLSGLSLVSWGICSCFPSIHLCGLTLTLGYLQLLPLSGLTLVSWGICSCFLSAGSLLCLGVFAVASSQRAHSCVLGYLQLLPLRPSLSGLTLVSWGMCPFFPSLHLSVNNY